MGKKIRVLTHKWIDIDVDDIVYGESEGDNTRLFMNDGIKHLISGNLTETTQLIDTFSFLRISRQHLANLDYFEEYIIGAKLVLWFNQRVFLRVSQSKIYFLLHKLDDLRGGE